MPLYQDEGVVLRTAKLGEADRILTLLTRDHGKVRAVAKGVRRTKSRFGGRLEPFMRVALLIAEGRSLDVVSQAESIAAYAGPICADFQAYTAANVMRETADKLVATEKEPAVAQYRLVLGALNALAKHAHEPSTIGDSYVLRALAISWLDTPSARLRGVRRADFVCAVLVFFDSRRRPDVRRRPYPRIGSGVVGCDLPAFGACRWRLGELDGVPASASIQRETHQIVEEWGEYYLERPIRSMRLLD